MSDYNKPYLDLRQLLPRRLRTKPLLTLIGNLFNKQLTKPETLQLYGWVGEKDTPDVKPTDVYVSEPDLDRAINQLEPTLYAQHATEEFAWTWQDLLQRLVLQGVDYATIDRWCRSQRFNFAPPIDLDKFVNFNEYFWIGSWVQQFPALNYTSLGIPDATTYLAPFFAASNPDYLPEYYVIERGDLDLTGAPLGPQPTLPTWSPWSFVNLWVHKEDLVTFYSVNAGLLNFDDLKPALRPIIEYKKSVKLNTYVNGDGAPDDAGTYQVVDKISPNQPPLFDLYHRDGAHANLVSSIFHYKESPEAEVDAELNRRLVTDNNIDFIFSQSMQLGDEVLFYKQWNDVDDYDLETVWQPGPVVAARYVKLDNTGLVINPDKLQNFRNYFWVGATLPSAELPSYNPTGSPEYYVIEAGGTSDWSVYNFWRHVSTLNRADLPRYVQAARPIVEFNVLLEPELLEPKTAFEQLPRFTHYFFNQDTDTYEALPSVNRPFYNDEYANFHLVADVTDLAPLDEVILANNDQRARTFTVAGRTFVQGLYNGYYELQSGPTYYGFTYPPIYYTGAGDGVLSIVSVNDLTTVPEVYILEALSPTTFTVTGTVTGTYANATVGVTYDNGSVKFTVLAGATPFQTGDRFMFELKTPVWQLEQAYVKLGTVYKTASEPAAIYQSIDTQQVVPADINQLNGVWELPPQLSGNLENENRADIKQGDLYFHFASIISSQPDLVGTQFGKNNWRDLPAPNLGLGGQIHQFNDNFNLLSSVLIQEQLTTESLIEFARSQYEAFLQAIRAYVEEYGADEITAGTFDPPTSGASVDPAAVAAFKEYFKRRGLVVDASASVVDDYITEPFYDTTSSIENLIVTLPYLGLAEPVQPNIGLDLEVNLTMLTHHDGHKSRLYNVELELIRGAVAKSYSRSNGQTTPGLVSGGLIPQRPFKNQFWYNMATGQLLYYNVASDTGELPSGVAVGTFSYDRQTDSIWQYNGTWVSLPATPGNLATPWTVVRFDLLVDNLTLALETELYQKVGPRQPRVNDAYLQSLAEFSTKMEGEMVRYAAGLGITDPFASNYNPDSPFTWNYSQASLLPYSTETRATWQELYRLVYGTPRVDLEPWVACEETQAAFLTAVGLVSFNPATDWANVTVQNHVIARLIMFGKPPVTSVDFTTGALLPPFSWGAPQTLAPLFSWDGVNPGTPPLGPAERYQFGDLGPVELVWTRSTDYLYAIQKTYFKLDPLHYTDAVWGYENQFVELYELYREEGRKQPQSAFRVHGDFVTDLAQHGQLSAGLLNLPLFDLTYTFKLVNRIDGVVQVTRSDGVLDFVGVGVTYFDEYLQVLITDDRVGLRWGDTFTVTVSSFDGAIGVSFTPFTTYRFEGWNQVYVQYHRYFGKALEISRNLTFLRDWTGYLGYRFSGLVNTDTLSVSTDLGEVDKRDFKVLLKENKFLGSYWLNAVRVQLVQRGATAPNNFGQPAPIGQGEDWVFRVDVFNPKQPVIEWYEFDTSGDYQTFLALGGQSTAIEWKKFMRPVAIRSFAAPFLLTGIQNVINFLYGYWRRLEDAGWRFNDAENPRLDPLTGRVDGWQPDIEKWIDQQYRGVQAGSGYTFNQFRNKVWFVTPRGVVASLSQRALPGDPLTETLLNINAQAIDPANVRVFRNDELTQIVCDVDLYTLHLTVSEYEHLLLVNKYTNDGRLILDQFLGQQVSRVLLNGERQVNFNGRLSFGGHYLLGGEFKRNVENSVSSMLTYYDSDLQVEGTPETEHARALLGFKKKQYFADRNMNDKSEFKFWQGMIKNKGTNLSVDAFFNSVNYRTSALDEYWAYKVAEYGDARPFVKPELMVERQDCTSELVRYLFLEANSLTVDNGYDVQIYDLGGYDADDLQTESFDTEGSIVVAPTDESRWYNFDDLGAMQYFEAEVLAETVIVPTDLELCYDVRDDRGNLVRADAFEVINLSALYPTTAYSRPPYDATLEETGARYIYREPGDYIVPTDPAEFSLPKFTRVNASTIKFNDPALLGQRLKVVAYGPGFRKHSPMQLYSYRDNNVLVKSDLILWDPARGSHHPRAFAQVDISDTKDLARYNVAARTVGNVNFDTVKPWSEEQVGTYWWNTEDLSWLPYSDTKIYPSMNDRLALWGATADFSSVKVYEWMESPVPPAQYEKFVSEQSSTDAEPAQYSGKPAIKETLKRTRSWKSRTVAWKYSLQPSVMPRSFAQSTSASIVLSGWTVGAQTATLSAGRFTDYSLSAGDKFGAAYYPNLPKLSNDPLKPFGQALITSEPRFVVGDLTNFTNGGSFVASANVSGFTLTTDATLLSTYFTTLSGQVTFSSEVDGGVQYLRATFVNTGDTQRVQVEAGPPVIGALVSYNFDQLGLKFSGNVSVASLSAAQLATAFSAAHVTYVRAQVDVFVEVPFELTDPVSVQLTTLDSLSTGSNYAWIGWRDPVDLASDYRVPNNRYEAFTGDYGDVSASDLQLLSNTIRARDAAPWVTPEGVSYPQFAYIWAPWELMTKDVRTAKLCVTSTYTLLDYYQDHFSFTTTEGQPELARLSVYLNGRMLKTDQWYADDYTPPTPNMIVVKLMPDVTFNEGDSLRVELAPYAPTQEDLAYDPSVADPDPLKLTQYLEDYPFVASEVHNEFGTLVKVRYFFWVKDKLRPARGKSLPIKRVQALLTQTDDVYGVVQIYRYFNQLSGEPNRYGLVSLNNFGRYVNRDHTYKLRLTKNETLRENDLNIRLKNVHEEWTLIRPQQPVKLPRALWDSLTDTACGQNALGQPLPSAVYASYDERNNRTSRYGFSSGQVMVDQNVAVDTLKYTIRNPQTYTYDAEFNRVPDFISFVGFDLSQLDAYFATPASTRQFMGDLWNNAKPKQLNELFFAVLNDALSVQPQLADIFKTSFVTLFDVRTVVTALNQ